MFALATTFFFEWKEPKVWDVEPYFDFVEILRSTVVPNERFARPPPVVML